MTRKIKTLTLLLAAAFALTGLLAPSASAAPPPPHLEKFVSPPTSDGPTATIHYRVVAGGDAPGSPAPKALRIETGPNTAEPFSYAGALVRGTNTAGRALADINRLSFKTKGDQGAGAPRLSVTLSNGTVAYLSAFYCEEPLAPSAWFKANFTASFAVDPTCTIYTSTAPGNTGVYTSDATSSAWQKLVAGEGAGTTVTRVELVKDEPGITYVDDIGIRGFTFAGPTVNDHS